MIKRFKNIIRSHRRHQRRAELLNGINFGNGDREFFLVSFPKAGNTWMRIMISYLVSGEDEIAFHNIGNFVPDTDQLEQLGPVRDRSSSFYNLPVQVLKSHDYFLPFYRGKKVIYVVRNGVDCLTSYYHYANARVESSYPHEAFVEGNDAKIKSWPKHLCSWRNAPTERQLIVKYEDIKKDAVKELFRVSEFLGIGASAKKIADAVTKSDFGRMKRLERKYGYFKDNRTGKGKSSPFVRKRKVGAKSDVFTKEQIKRFKALSYNAAKL